MESSTTETTFGEWVGHNLFFNDVIESDTREPIIVFSVPDSLLRLLHLEEGGNKFGFMAPQLQFWTALVTTLVIGFIFNSFMSCLVYQFMVLPRKLRNSQKGKQSVEPITAYIVGFGIVMPLCAISPYYALRYFGVKNKIIKFMMGVAQLTSFFRCSEAMFNFLPTHVDESFKNLISYTAFPVEVKFNSNGPIQSTWANSKYYLVNWIKYIFILGAYKSILLSYDYQPFPNEEGPALQDVRLWTGFTPGQLINNMACAVLFQVYLTTFGYGLSFIASVCGFQLIEMMLNPIFESKSISDFWGRKWNMVVHGILKRGVYKPVRKFKFSRLTASTATFIASGIFHEWLLSVVFYPDHDDGTCSPICYHPGYGRNTLFMFWNAILIGFEYAIGGWAIFQLFREHLPVTVVSLMVASTALPTAHWFTNDYVRSDFFNDSQSGFPLIVRL